MKNFQALVFLVVLLNTCSAQPDRWQQRISYNINVKMNVATNRFNGIEKIDYFNNSPDTLYRVFFHTYWNAFQRNSSMDVRSRELGKTVLGMDKLGNEVRDWDPRVKDRILHLKPDEIGYQKVSYVNLNGKPQILKDHETILEVVLDKPLLPKSKTVFQVSFEAQVPVHVRRSGRDNAEGVRYSMAQWYPKMVEYDYQGWNANPYVAREFHGVWGDYNVKINIDKSYMVAASGTLQNANQIGFGYEGAGVKVVNPSGSTLTWNFVANNVHDFVWAADTDYAMIKRKIRNGPLLYIVHKNVDSLNAFCEKLADTVVLAYPVMAKTFGPYPYKNYSFIQGGDGGMEYPMATLIKNAGIGTAIHEWMHSWYQGMLGTNESLYPWMDEGFTTYAAERVLGELRQKKTFVQEGSYTGYFRLAKSGYEEPMTTHSDHYNTNYAYSNAAYSKGAVFLAQLGYIVGDKVRDKILLDYYRQWRFKHPNANDFIRVAEKASGMELDWYKEYWVNTTKTIDYAIDSLWEENGKTNIRIKRVGEMPMPIDVQIIFKDSTKELHNIPLNLMYGQKAVESDTVPTTVHNEWLWTHPTYTIETNRKLLDISGVQIDPSQRLADIDPRNNLLKIQW
ncbi:MAG TPA: M1 family metallopeptidase [Segetibacter sp.]|nr:M1 family metallopeptidase [Segetibacter sp.]